MHGSRAERTGRSHPGGATFRRKTAATPARGRGAGGQDCPESHGGLLSAIYEEDFLGFSYGFRPGRSQHDALDALIVGTTSRKVNFILDADIRSMSVKRLPALDLFQ
jgi:hypothetical protein